MYRETIAGEWEREPIFASSRGGGKEYFSHIFYKGEQVGTARTGELGEGDWEAFVEDADGEFVHCMSRSYDTYHEAILDVADWFAGQ